MPKMSKRKAQSRGAVAVGAHLLYLFTTTSGTAASASGTAAVAAPPAACSAYAAAGDAAGDADDNSAIAGDAHTRAACVRFPGRPAAADNFAVLRFFGARFGAHSP